MTLVAAWKEQDVPILIGDLLTTGESPAPHRKLPTRDDLDAALKLPDEWCVPDNSVDWKITGTVQKLYQLADSLVIGCAGSGLTAQILVREAIERFQGGRPKLKDVRAFFHSQTQLSQPPSTVVGWIADSDEITAFRWKSDSPARFETAESFIDGSGAPYLAEIFRPDHPEAYSDPVRSALSKVTTLLAAELRRGSNLTGRFGAGYQVLVWERDRFIPLSSVAYVFLRGMEADSGIDYAPERRMLKTFRVNDIEHTLALVKDRATPGGIQQLLFLTLPLNWKGTVPVPEPGSLSLTSDFYCIDVEVQCRASIAVNCTFVATGDEEVPPVRIVGSPGELQEIELHSSVLRRVSEFVRHLDRSAVPVRARFYLD